MAVTTFWYAISFISAYDKEIDFIADSIDAQLHLNAYTPNQDTHDYQDDLTDEVASANGYVTGGDTPGTPDNSNALNVVKWDTADPQWTATGAGFTARRIVLLDSTPGTAGTNPLILWSDFGTDETASGGGTFTYAVNAGGWATATPADASGFP